MQRDNQILRRENIRLNVGSISKQEAIQTAGEMLVNGGYVKPEYISDMFEREKVYNTYIGNGIAIPHGINRCADHIKQSGIVVLQSKEGIQYGEDVAYLVIGIAAVGDEHVDILSSIALSLQSEVSIEKARNAGSKEDLFKLLGL